MKLNYIIILYLQQSKIDPQLSRHEVSKRFDWPIFERL